MNVLTSENTTSSPTKSICYELPLSKQPRNFKERLTNSLKEKVKLNKIEKEQEELNTELLADFNLQEANKPFILCHYDKTISYKNILDSIITTNNHKNSIVDNKHNQLSNLIRNNTHIDKEDAHKKTETLVKTYCSKTSEIEKNINIETKEQGRIQNKLTCLENDKMTLTDRLLSLSKNFKSAITGVRFGEDLKTKIALACEDKSVYQDNLKKAFKNDTKLIKQVLNNKKDNIKNEKNTINNLEADLLKMKETQKDRTKYSKLVKQNLRQVNNEYNDLRLRLKEFYYIMNNISVQSTLEKFLLDIDKRIDDSMTQGNAEELSKTMKIDIKNLSKEKANQDNFGKNISPRNLIMPAKGVTRTSNLDNKKPRLDIKAKSYYKVESCDDVYEDDSRFHTVSPIRNPCKANTGWCRIKSYSGIRRESTFGRIDDVKGRVSDQNGSNYDKKIISMKLVDHNHHKGQIDKLKPNVVQSNREIKGFSNEKKGVEPFSKEGLILLKLERFFENNPDGPSPLADKIINKYKSICDLNLILEKTCKHNQQDYIEKAQYCKQLCHENNLIKGEIIEDKQNHYENYCKNFQSSNQNPQFFKKNSDNQNDNYDVYDEERISSISGQLNINKILLKEFYMTRSKFQKGTTNNKTAYMTSTMGIDFRIANEFQEKISQNKTKTIPYSDKDDDDEDAQIKKDIQQQRKSNPMEVVSNPMKTNSVVYLYTDIPQFVTQEIFTDIDNQELGDCQEIIAVEKPNPDFDKYKMTTVNTADYCLTNPKSIEYYQSIVIKNSRFFTTLQDNLKQFLFKIMSFVLKIRKCSILFNKSIEQANCFKVIQNCFFFIQKKNDTRKRSTILDYMQNASKNPLIDGQLTHNPKYFQKKETVSGEDLETLLKKYIEEKSDHLPVFNELIIDNIVMDGLSYSDFEQIFKLDKDKPTIYIIDQILNTSYNNFVKNYVNLIHNSEKILKELFNNNLLENIIAHKDFGKNDSLLRKKSVDNYHNVLQNSSTNYLNLKNKTDWDWVSKKWKEVMERKINEDDDSNTNNKYCRRLTLTTATIKAEKEGNKMIDNLSVNEVAHQVKDHIKEMQQEKLNKNICRESSSLSLKPAKRPNKQPIPNISVGAPLSNTHEGLNLQVNSVEPGRIVQQYFNNAVCNVIGKFHNRRLTQNIKDHSESLIKKDNTVKNVESNHKNQRRFSGLAVNLCIPNLTSKTPIETRRKSHIYGLISKNSNNHDLQEYAKADNEYFETERNNFFLLKAMNDTKETQIEENPDHEQFKIIKQNSYTLKDQKKCFSVQKKRTKKYIGLSNHPEIKSFLLKQDYTEDSRSRHSGQSKSTVRNTIRSSWHRKSTYTSRSYVALTQNHTKKNSKQTLRNITDKSINLNVTKNQYSNQDLNANVENSFEKFLNTKSEYYPTQQNLGQTISYSRNYFKCPNAVTPNKDYQKKYDYAEVKNRLLSKKSEQNVDNHTNEPTDTSMMSEFFQVLKIFRSD